MYTQVSPVFTTSRAAVMQVPAIDASDQTFWVYKLNAKEKFVLSAFLGIRDRVRSIPTSFPSSYSRKKAHRVRL
jgi:hypothetical protein